MATRRDMQILTIIRYEKDQAKKRREDVGIYLSGGERLYAKAVNSQRNAGIATIVCGVLGVIALSVKTVTGLNAIGMTQNLLSYATVVILISGVGIIMGTKTYSLNITPTTMLILTILQLLYSLFLLVGFIPLVSVIFNIIALVRWSTYRNWFNDIDVEYYKERARKHETQKHR